jgi:hypothetical protein
MLKAVPVATLCLVAISAQVRAETAGIQNHKVQQLFMTQPCIMVINTIDRPDGDVFGGGMMTMAFGFLMGFEAAHPGIRGDQETILKRLRADCTIDSNQTAFDLLQGYATE